MADDFDCDKWPIIRHALTPAPTTFTAGRGISGSKQVRRIPNGYWRGPVVLNPLHLDDMVDFRGWLASLDGSGETFDLCMCQPGYTTVAATDPGFNYEGYITGTLGLVLADLCGPVGGLYSLPFSDGTCFADGTGFDAIPNPGLATPVADTTGSGVMGATSITLGTSTTFVRGTYFSTPDNYLHVVTSVVGSTLNFRPALRSDLPAGSLLEAKKPKFKVRLSGDEGGTLTQNHQRWSDEVTLNVEEVLTR